jgi:cytochrome c1
MRTATISTTPCFGRLAASAFIMVLLAAPFAASASESSWPMEPMTPDLENLPSLQSGWKLYMNYCVGCHSLKHQRYERTADDLGIPHDLVLKDLIFTDQKIGSQITTAMDPSKAKNWFGAPPPDLTMVARVRGAEWIYNYLKTFYLDDSRPLGVNNKVFENVGMPNVLLELQGVQKLGCVQVPKVAENGGEMRDPLTRQPITEEKCGELVVEDGTGQMTADEFNRAVYDLTNFLYYVGDPSRLDRYRIGVYVILFLIILYVFTYLLAREFQKDVKH